MLIADQLKVSRMMSIESKDRSTLAHSNFLQARHSMLRRDDISQQDSKVMNLVRDIRMDCAEQKSVFEESNSLAIDSHNSGSKSRIKQADNMMMIVGDDDVPDD